MDFSIISDADVGVDADMGPDREERLFERQGIFGPSEKGLVGGYPVNEAFGLDLGRNNYPEIRGQARERERERGVGNGAGQAGIGWEIRTTGGSDWEQKEDGKQGMRTNDHLVYGGRFADGLAGMLIDGD